MEPTRRLAVRVGAFAVVATAAAVVVVMLLGREQLWFREKTSFRGGFPDVAGLQEGAVVRLGGRNVGVVTDISFGDPRDRDRAIVVTLRVRGRHAERIRADSVMRIATQGLLGDKLLEISLGSPDAPPLPEGGWIRTEPPVDASQLLGTATRAFADASRALARLEPMQEDLAAAAATLRRVAARVEQGPGLAHDLVYDRRVFAELRRTAATARAAADRLVLLTDAVDREALRAASRDLAAVTAHVRAGRGTLGGLIMDPTLYEETKRVLVNVRRSRVLRALTRYAISREEDGPVMDASPSRVRARPGSRKE